MDRPLTLRAHDVRAILNGRKTQHRTVLRNPEYFGCPTGDCPHERQAECDAAMAGLSSKDIGAAVGDRLWVSWREGLTLIVTDVRVQRLQDISRGDAMDEGCPFANMADGPDPRLWYADVWNAAHGTGAWDRNDWVVARTFEVLKSNIDEVKHG
jgi:hypothetical protein